MHSIILTTLLRCISTNAENYIEWYGPFLNDTSSDDAKKFWKNLQHRAKMNPSSASYKHLETVEMTAAIFKSVFEKLTPAGTEQEPILVHTIESLHLPLDKSVAKALCEGKIDVPNLVDSFQTRAETINPDSHGLRYQGKVNSVTFDVVYSQEDLWTALTIANENLGELTVKLGLQEGQFRPHLVYNARIQKFSFISSGITNQELQAAIVDKDFAKAQMRSAFALVGKDGSIASVRGDWQCWEGEILTPGNDV
jgi:hypothetical protein